MRAVGVDVSPQQLVAARERWGWTSGLQLHQADAISFLREDQEGFAAVYSVYGAVWFTDPARLLPAIRERLRPGGRLVFSQRPPVEGCYGCQASYIPRGADEDPLVVKRWDYEPDAWERLLMEHGFSDVSADVLAAPPGNRKTGTLIVRGARLNDPPARPVSVPPSEAGRSPSGGLFQLHAHNVSDPDQRVQERRGVPLLDAWDGASERGCIQPLGRP